MDKGKRLVTASSFVFTRPLEQLLRSGFLIYISEKFSVIDILISFRTFPLIINLFRLLVKRFGSEEPNRLLCKTKRGRKLRPHRSHIIPELRPDTLYHFLPCSGVLQVLLGKILLSGMLSFQTSRMGCHCLLNTPCQVRSNHIQAPL